MMLGNRKGKAIGKKLIYDDAGNPMEYLVFRDKFVDRDFTKVFFGKLLDQIEENQEADVGSNGLLKGLGFLGKLVGLMGYDNHIRMTQNEIAEPLELSVSATKRFLGTLEKLDLLVSKGHGDYMISPEVFSQVGNKERIIAWEEWMKIKAKKRHSKLEKCCTV